MKSLQPEGNASMNGRTRRVAERGQIIPFVALSIVVILGFAALAIDLGFWRIQHQLEQTAADSAALAGAVSLAYQSNAATLTAAARTDAGSNGFVHDGVGVNVTVNAPPAAGPYAGNVGAVEVVVSKRQPTFFSGIFGRSYQVISARAVALVSAQPNCIYALNPSATSVAINGGTVVAPKCGIVSDADMELNGATVTAASIGYAGNFTGSSGSATVPHQSLPASDPCPTISGCAYLKANPPIAGVCLTSPQGGASNVTMNPGTYCAKLTLNGNNNVTFAPGFYFLEQGMQINGGVNISGSGVTFYSANDSVLQVNGPKVSFSAPTTGLTAGVLFYQVPSDTTPLQFNGGVGSTLAGAVYLPNAALALNGADDGSWTLIIAAQFQMNGGNLNVAGSAFPGITHAVLAE